MTPIKMNPEVNEPTKTVSDSIFNKINDGTITNQEADYLLSCFDTYEAVNYNNHEVSDSNSYVIKSHLENTFSDRLGSTSNDTIRGHSRNDHAKNSVCWKSKTNECSEDAYNNGAMFLQNFECNESNSQAMSNRKRIYVHNDDYFKHNATSPTATEDYPRYKVLADKNFKKMKYGNSEYVCNNNYSEYEKEKGCVATYDDQGKIRPTLNHGLPVNIPALMKHGDNVHDDKTDNDVITGNIKNVADLMQPNKETNILLYFSSLQHQRNKYKYPINIILASIMAWHQFISSQSETISNDMKISNLNKMLEVLLSKTHPSIFTKPDGPTKGGTLHLILQYMPWNVELIDMVLLRNIQCASMVDGKGNTPMHIAVRYSTWLQDSAVTQSIEAINHLLLLNPLALQQTNINGLTPCEMATYQSNCSEKISIFLLKKTDELTVVN